MTRTSRLTALLLALAALAVTPAGSAAQGGGGFATVQTQVIYHFEDVAPPLPFTFNVTCPKGWVAISGATTRENNPAILVVFAGPAPSPRVWIFTVVNTIGPPGPGRTVTAGVAVTCARAVLPAVNLPPAQAQPPGVVGQGQAQLSPLIGPPVNLQISPFNSASGTSTCPKGSVPVGEKVQQGAAAGPRLARPASVGGVAETQITSAMPMGRSMAFSVRNPTGVEQQVSLSAHCLRRRVKTEAGKAKIQVKTSVLELAAQPGDQTFFSRCKGGAILSAGFSLPADGRISFLGANPDRRGLTIGLGNHTALAEPGQIAPICARGEVTKVSER